MKYGIGARIDFIYKDGSDDDFHEYYEIVAYAITKDGQIVYVIWSNYSEYSNEYKFMTEDKLSEEIEIREDYCIVKIREEECVK